MSWNNLTPAEVQAVRMGLHLSVAEAAEWIAGHASPRTWQRYEDGTRSVPDDIDIELYALSQIAEEQFELHHAAAFEATQKNIKYEIQYFKSVEDWKKENSDSKPVLWRIHQSVASRIFREFGSTVELI